MKNSVIRIKKDSMKKSHKSDFSFAIKQLSTVLNDAKEFIKGCKSDFELFSFMHKYEKIKFKKRRLRVKIRRAVNNFLLSFPVYWQVRIKRYTDLVLAIIALIVFTPIMLLISLFIKLSSKGPVLYKQERVGKDGKHFIMYKFRSMYINAESETGPVWSNIDNDSRVTSIGNFIRKSHLDELPQLFNVLKNEMSIVGPRPERPFFVNKLKNEIPEYENRLDVKPGITGLAQVRHKYDETIADVQKKLKYDLIYIKKMCLTLDMKVLIWTISIILSGKVIR